LIKSKNYLQADIQFYYGLGPEPDKVLRKFFPPSEQEPHQMMRHSREKVQKYKFHNTGVVP
jgi:hypothetical protein